MIRKSVTEQMRVDDILDLYAIEDSQAVLQHPDNQALLDGIAQNGMKGVTGELHIPQEVTNLPKITPSELNVFILQPAKSVLDVIMLDVQGKPLANKPYTLLVGKQEIQATTDGDGRVYQEIETSNKEGLLVLHISEEEDVLQLVLFVEREAVNQEEGFNQRLKERGFFKGASDLPDNADLELIYQQAQIYPV